MARPAVDEPSLRPTASPVDRFVAPRMQQPAESGLTDLANTLQQINPRLQNFLAQTNAENAKQQEAQGRIAEAQVDPDISLADNRQGWQQLLAEARRVDRETGGNNADILAGTSPHFRRGLAAARAERLGRGLQQHLSNLWNENTDGIKNVDDLEAVQEWVSEKSKEYAEKFGINSLDPVIASERYMPFVAQAQDKLVGHHTEFRAASRTEEYRREFAANVGWMTSGGEVGDTPPGQFLQRLSGSESSGNPGAFRTNKDGRQFGGLVQMGQGRLDEWAEATGNDKITVAQYKEMSASQQMSIAKWHLADIDKEIDESGYLAKGWSRDGLRAVAHLGGKGGMHEFVMSGGQYNPSDELGTSLQDYYARFSSTASGLQRSLDEAVANGMDPKKANETLVESVIAQAEATGNPEAMSVLMQIDTGSGPLGNIGWVKSAVTEAEERISDEQWETETRERQREEREREANRRELQIEGFRQVMEDPMADISGYVSTVRDAGYPDLATRIMSFQQTLQDRDRQVYTNHNRVMEIRAEILRGETSREDIIGMIQEGVSEGAFSSNTGLSLVDDLGRDSSLQDYATDSLVRRSIQEASSIVEEEFKGGSDFFSMTGDQSADAKAMALQFENEMYDELAVFLEDNPEASMPRVRKFMRETAAKLAKDTRYQKPEPEYTPPPSDGESTSSNDGDNNGGGWSWLPFVGGGGDDASQSEQETPASVDEMSLSQIRQMHQQYMEDQGVDVPLEEFIDSLQ